MNRVMFGIFLLAVGVPLAIANWPEREPLPGDAAARERNAAMLQRQSERELALQLQRDKREADALQARRASDRARAKELCELHRNLRLERRANYCYADASARACKILIWHSVRAADALKALGVDAYSKCVP